LEDFDLRIAVRSWETNSITYDIWHITYHKQNICLTINNIWVDIYSKSIWQCWTWIHAVKVNVNDLLISIVDQWPFRNIIPIFCDEIPQSVPMLYPVEPSCIRLSHMNDHDEKWSQIQFDRTFIVSMNIDNQIWSIEIQLFAVCHLSSFIVHLSDCFAFANHNSTFWIKFQFQSIVWLIGA
jgi:hypothetical protein